MKASHFLTLLCLTFCGKPASAAGTRSFEADTDPVRVAVTVQPPPGATAWTIEEHLPASAVATDLSHQGIWDAANQTAKWGPFFDDAPRTVEYRIVLAPGTNASLAGALAADGAETPTVGSVTTPAAGNSFPAWQLLNFGPAEFFTFRADPRFDGDGDGMPNIHEYAFAGNPAHPDSARLPRVVVPPNDSPIVEFSAPREALGRIVIEVMAQPWGDVLGLFSAADWADGGSSPVAQIHLPLGTFALDRLFVRVGVDPQP